MSDSRIDSLIAVMDDPCKLVQALTLDELYTLSTLPPPLGQDVLHHASKCGACKNKLNEARRHHVASLPESERKQIQDLTKRVIAAAQAGRTSGLTLMKRGVEHETERSDSVPRTVKRQPGQQRRPLFAPLPLAASDTDEDPTGTRTHVPFAAFEVERHAIEALADPEGMVFLRGDVPAGAKKLYLGDDGFVLKRLSEVTEVEVENLGSVDLEEFLDRQRGDPESFPIRFGE